MFNKMDGIISKPFIECRITLDRQEATRWVTLLLKAQDEGEGEAGLFQIPSRIGRGRALWNTNTSVMWWRNNFLKCTGLRWDRCPIFGYSSSFQIPQFTLLQVKVIRRFHFLNSFSNRRMKKFDCIPLLDLKCHKRCNTRN